MLAFCSNFVLYFLCPFLFCSHLAEVRAGCFTLTLKVTPIICSRREFQICRFFKNNKNKSGIIFHESRLLADDSHEILYVILFENWKWCRKICRLLQLWLALWGFKYSCSNVESLSVFTACCPFCCRWSIIVFVCVYVCVCGGGGGVDMWIFGLVLCVLSSFANLSLSKRNLHELYFNYILAQMWCFC